MSRIEAIQLTRQPFEFKEFANQEINKQTTDEWLLDSIHIMDLMNSDLYKKTLFDEGLVEWYFAVDKATKITQYAVKVADIHIPPLRAGCQVGVWSDPEFATPFRFAPKIFWEVLFVKHDMISDKIQTDFGKRFWVGRIGEAYTKQLYVYMMKVKGSKIVEIHRLHTLEDFNLNRPLIWGKSIKSQSIRLAITKRPLKFS